MGPLPALPVLLNELFTPLREGPVREGLVRESVRKSGDCTQCKEEGRKMEGGGREGRIVRESVGGGGTKSG